MEKLLLSLHAYRTLNTHRIVFDKIAILSSERASNCTKNSILMRSPSISVWCDPWLVQVASDFCQALIIVHENGKISEMDNALCLEWNDACLQFAILVALDSKAAVKGQAKPSRLQPSHEKKERQLAIGWVAHEDGKAHRSMETLEQRVPTTSGVRQDR